MKRLCLLVIGLTLIAWAGPAEAAWPASTYLSHPGSGVHVDCVANIDSDGYAQMLCADPWPHAVIKTQYHDAAANRWHFSTKWTWNGPAEGQLLSVFIGEKPNDGRDWRVVYKVRDGLSGDGRCDGRAVLGWYQGG